MNLTKLGPFEAGLMLSTDKDGFEHIVVVAKATFQIARNGKCVLADVQQPLVYADEFVGEPGLSATRYECDFPPFKPRCDVLVNGAAYAPGGRATKHVSVGLKMGRISKQFEVVGDRIWDNYLVSSRVSSTQSFERMPIDYGRAFGGVDLSQGDPPRVETYAANPVGVGYYPLSSGRRLAGKPLPNTQQIGSPATNTTGKYRPMSFGPRGRNFAARIPYAGTYDQEWMDKVFPFLPRDFDTRYYQAAPEDQQVDYPNGGEEVELTGLTSRAKTFKFTLPRMNLPVRVFYASEEEDLTSVIDTVIIEPDAPRCILVWRATARLRTKPTDLYEVWVGRPTRGRLRALETDKTYVGRQ